MTHDYHRDRSSPHPDDNPGVGKMGQAVIIWHKKVKADPTLGIQQADWIDSAIMDVHGLNTYLGPKYRVFNLRWSSPSSRNDYYENNWRFNCQLRVKQLENPTGNLGDESAGIFEKQYYNVDDFINYMEKFVRITCYNNLITKKEQDLAPARLIKLINGLLFEMYREYPERGRSTTRNPVTIKECLQDLFKFVHAFTGQVSERNLSGVSPGVGLFDPYGSIGGEGVSTDMPMPELSNGRAVIRKIWGKTITVAARSYGDISQLYVASVEDKIGRFRKLETRKLAGGIKEGDIVTSINQDRVILSDMNTAMRMVSELNDMDNDRYKYMGFNQGAFTTEANENAFCNGLVIDNRGIHLARRIIHALDANIEEANKLYSTREVRRLLEGRGEGAGELILTQFMKSLSAE